MPGSKDPGYLAPNSQTLGDMWEELKRKLARAKREAGDAADKAPGVADSIADFFKRVRKGYADTANQAPESFRNIREMVQKAGSK